MIMKPKTARIVNQYEKTIINGFHFKPVEEKIYSEIYKKMYTLFTGKKLGVN